MKVLFPALFKFFRFLKFTSSIVFFVIVALDMALRCFIQIVVFFTFFLDVFEYPIVLLKDFYEIGAKSAVVLKIHRNMNTLVSFSVVKLFP